MPIKSKYLSESKSKAPRKASAQGRAALKVKPLKAKAVKGKALAAKKKLATPKSEKDLLAAIPAAAQERGFMWKLLKRKQEEQKKRASGRQSWSPNPEERAQGHYSAGHGRFAGPRRRAA